MALLQAPSRTVAAEAGRLRPWPENPHYLAWDDTPVFPLGATGYHSWTPISRPGTVDFEEQMDRLAAVIGVSRSSPFAFQVDWTAHWANEIEFGWEQ